MNLNPEMHLSDPLSPTLKKAATREAFGAALCDIGLVYFQMQTGPRLTVGLLFFGVSIVLLVLRFFFGCGWWYRWGSGGSRGWW